MPQPVDPKQLSYLERIGANRAIPQIVRQPVLAVAAPAVAVAAVKAVAPAPVAARPVAPVARPAAIVKVPTGIPWSLFCWKLFRLVMLLGLGSTVLSLVWRILKANGHLVLLVVVLASQSACPADEYARDNSTPSFDGLFDVPNNNEFNSIVGYPSDLDSWPMNPWEPPIEANEELDPGEQLSKVRQSIEESSELLQEFEIQQAGNEHRPNVGTPSEKTPKSLESRVDSKLLICVLALVVSLLAVQDVRRLRSEIKSLHRSPELPRNPQKEQATRLRQSSHVRAQKPANKSKLQRRKLTDNPGLADINDPLFYTRNYAASDKALVPDEKPAETVDSGSAVMRLQFRKKSVSESNRVSGVHGARMLLSDQRGRLQLPEQQIKSVHGKLPELDHIEQSARPWTSCVRSVQGNVRKENQDAASQFVLDVAGRRFDIAIVADGCGGVPRGAQASSLAVRVAQQTLRDQLQSGIPTRQAVEQTFRSVSDHLADEARRAGYSELTTRRERRDFGFRTTLIIVVNHGDTTTCGYIGDGAVIVSDADGAVHSLLSPHREDGRSNVLTASLGPVTVGQHELLEHIRQPGALTIACTDGVADLFTPEALAEHVRVKLCDHGGNAQEAIDDTLQRWSDTRDSAGYVCDDNMTLALLLDGQIAKSEPSVNFGNSNTRGVCETSRKHLRANVDHVEPVPFNSTSTKGLAR
ncbi:MAG: protein phosphatase 2C domain-containing protein [Planctomyces sp.]|nr:protein phosphatase 2C domain-containing protein [Planctomyces sp.]